MPKIEFSRGQKEALAQKIQRYFSDELDQEIDQFPAEFLLEFFAEKVGPYFYNQGLLDAQAILEARLDDVTQAIDELAQPVDE